MESKADGKLRGFLPAIIDTLSREKSLNLFSIARRAAQRNGRAAAVCQKLSA
jgi:hypothetical protein